MEGELHDNPYQSFGQHDPDTAPDAFDDQSPPTAPRVLGVLNIVFGSVLGLCFLCQGTWTAMQAAAGPQIQQAMQQQQQSVQAELQQLEQEIQSAESDEEARQLQQQIDRLNEQMRAFQAMPNPAQMMGMNDVRVIAFFALTCVFGVLLNLLMFVSGIGLLNYRSWARKLALWVAGLKIANLVVAGVVMVLVIAPAMAKGMEQFMEEVARQQNGAQVPAGEMRAGMMLGTTISVLFWVLLGSIYPVICLWQLNRTRVKEACR